MKRVLIVEDQNDIRKLVRMTLEFEDYEIHEAIDGAAGLRMVAQVRPDLVLLDVMMPGDIDGLEVCRQIKADSALVGVKVVLLSARGQARDREAGEKAGADVYLIKPFSPLELIGTIERLMVTTAPGEAALAALPAPAPLGTLAASAGPTATTSLLDVHP